MDASQKMTLRQQMGKILSSFSNGENKRKLYLRMRLHNWSRKHFPKEKFENWTEKEFSRLNRKIGEFHRMIIDFALSPRYIDDIKRKSNKNVFTFSDKFISTWLNFHTIVNEYNKYILSNKPEELKNYMNIFSNLDELDDSDD